MKTQSCLLTGGARSGKSRYALELAKGVERPWLIATGWAGDDEMQERIAKHQTERDDSWKVIEEQIKLQSAIEKAVNNGADFVLVDCISSWITNLMVNGSFIDIISRNEISSFIEVIKNIHIPLIIVTNEVGMGLVPDNKLGRDFRDNLGLVNQTIAETVEKVILMVSGLPVKIKG